MIKRIISGIAALACAAAIVPAASSSTFEYDFDAMTLTVPIDVVVPASVNAFLNPYNTTVVFNSETLEQDSDAVGENRLEMSGDIVSPTYTIENTGAVPVSVYASVYGEPLGNAVLVDSSASVGEWTAGEQQRSVNLWITGGLSKEAVVTEKYDITKSISIGEAEETRTLIECIDPAADGISGKGYFKINGKINKNAKSWSESDGIHINLALKIVPAE